MKTAKTPNFFHDKPLFGLDIGHGSLKVMQLEERVGKKTAKGSGAKLIGYGFTTFDKAALEDGVIVQHDVIAKAAFDMFKNHLIGDITTRRVAIAIPTYRTFTRSLQLPHLKPGEIKAAVELEAEQYISLPLEDLYFDYEVVKQTADSTDLFVVAVPRKIVDSYLELAHVLGLEAILIEPTLSSASRLFSLDPLGGDPGLIIDFGSQSSDISIVDKHLLVTGTVQGGGENFTQLIKTKLGVTEQEAGIIKTRYGLGKSKKQAEIQQALEPTLQLIIKEIRRMMRYYEEHYGTKHPIGQIITMGGGANMPGLAEYLTAAMRLPVRHSDPWQYVQHKGLEPPANADKPMFSTVAGLSLVHSKEVLTQ